MVLVEGEDEDKILDLVEDALPELFGIEDENLEQLHERINKRKDCSQMDKERRGIDLGW